AERPSLTIGTPHLDLRVTRCAALISKRPLHRLWAIPCALFVVALASCGGSQGSTPSPGARPRGLSVRVAPVAVQDVAYQIKVPGALEGEELVQITAEVEGAVKDVRFHEGDRVDRGTVLLRIDPERYGLELRRAQANHQRGGADARPARAHR